MATTLEQFAAECRSILKTDSGPTGRRRICGRLETLLRDPSFVSSLVNTATPERILAHNYNGARNSPPHDHGPSWAIYGQAKGETEMTDYALVAPPGEGKPGKARAVRTYKLTPGSAYLYNEGDLHSPLRRGPTQLIRIEGVNMDRVKRPKFEAVI
jgi:hypothetical protein